MSEQNHRLPPAATSVAPKPALLDPGRDLRPEAEQEDDGDYGNDREPAGAAEEMMEEEALA